ncbi:MFS transporter [Mucilaginibacter panaciglaebae]|uniref:Tetracycline resistance MFS efflux pump n=1 Tax=Mucilaginibacter panaciglaebae TaxID=502331 RepID=A0ABP7WY64_9SPHI
MKINRVLWILIFVCIIDSMGFGMMIPLIYSYGKQFGLTKQSLGWLTASFSVAQFFATPVLGALSDKYGRKLLLVICLFGTALSFALFGLAGSLIMLFTARIMDGITGGDISVAQAMVTDMSSSENRSKYFGLLGSAFGLGYVIGPAAGGLLSRFGMTVPFFVAAGLSLTAAVLSLIFLKETNNKKRKQARKKTFTYRSLIDVLKWPVIGSAVFTGFLLTTAQFVMLIGFQTYCTDALKLSPTQVGLFYAGFGITGILMQLAIPLINKVISSRSVVLLISTAICLGAMIFSGFAGTIIPFAIGIGVYGLFNGLRNPMLNAIIADHSEESKQGEIMGINQSYVSIGQAVGPAIAGLAAAVSLHAAFYLAGLLILIAFAMCTRLKRQESPS